MKNQNISDNYFGTIVPDPYRWLEDDNAPEVKEWVKNENKKTESFLSKIPFRKKIKNRLEEIWTYEKRSGILKKATIIIFLKQKVYKIKAFFIDKQILKKQKKIQNCFLTRIL